MAKSKNWYSKYKIHTKPKAQKGNIFLCDLPNGSMFRISSINYKGILLQVAKGGCYVIRKNAPKYSKMGKLLGKEDRKEYIGRRTEVNEWGEITNTDKYIKRNKKTRVNKSDSIGSRKDKRLLRMARKKRTNN